MTNPQNYPRKRPENFLGSGESRRWPTYLGITGLLLFILVALAGGIIWYNSKKSSELAIAAAQRLMQEAEDKSPIGSDCFTTQCMRSSASLRWYRN